MDKQVWIRKFLILTFIIPLIIYVKTLLPTVGFWDTGEFQTIPYTFDIGHPTGYPTYVLIGKIYLTIFSYGSVAWRMNLLSAISVSLGVYLFAKTLYIITNKSILSILISLLLSINPYLWSIAIVADPHSLHFLFTSIYLLLAIYIIKDKKFDLFPFVSLVCGLSLGNHMLSIFFLPPLLYLFIDCYRQTKIFRNIIISILFLLLGLSVYFTLPILYALKEPLLNIKYPLTSLDGFKRHIFGSDFQPLMNTWARDNFTTTIQFYYTTLKKAFPFLSFVLIPAGAVVLFRKNLNFAIFLTLLYLPTLLFSLKYQNAVIERYFINSYTIYWFSIGIFLSKITKKHIVYLTMILFFIFNYVFLIKTNYDKIDQSKNLYGENWSNNVLRGLEKNSVIFSWWSYSTPLWYMQKVENIREDVVIVNAGPNEWESLSLKYLEQHDIYFIQEIKLTNPNLSLNKSGDIYKLEVKTK